MSRQSNTDAPFATAQKAGRRMTYHYTLEAALESAKVSNKYRIVQAYTEATGKLYAILIKG